MNVLKSSRIENDQNQTVAEYLCFDSAKRAARRLSKINWTALVAVNGETGDCVRYYCGKQTAKT